MVSTVSQEPTILLVDIPEQAQAFATALGQVGRQARAITLHEVGPAFEHLNPIGIVAPIRHAGQIAEIVRLTAGAAGLPFFILEPPNQSASLRPQLPEVTAAISEEIDPGILAMRFQITLQRVGSLRSRQPTVVGLGSQAPPPASQAPAPPAAGVLPGAAPSAPAPLDASSASASAPEGTRPVTPASIPQASPRGSSAAPPPPAAVSTPPAAVSTPPAAVSTPPAAVSTPPAAVSTPPAAVSTPPAAVSTPPAAVSTPPAASTGAEGVVTSVRPEVTVPLSPASAPDPLLSASGTDAPLTSPPSPVASERPVSVTQASTAATSLDDDLAEMRAAPRQSTKTFLWVSAAAVAVGLLGAGAFALSGGDDDKAGDTAQAPSPDDAAAALSTSAPAEKPAGSTETTVDTNGPAAEVAAKPGEEGSQASAAPEAPGSVTDGPDPAGKDPLFAVERAVSMKTCEEVLGKSRDAYKTTPKWKAGQAWKLSRKSLMAGKQEGAQEKMCESAFIDRKGPAVAGLVKYYLGSRALEQAHIWATIGVEENPSGAPSRAAKQLLADVLSQMGKMEEARALWLESFNLTSDQTTRLAAVSKNFLVSAVSARKGGDSALAELLLRRAAAFDSDSSYVAALLADTLLANAQPELAKRWAERALEKDPESDLARGVMSRLGS